MYVYIRVVASVHAQRARTQDATHTNREISPQEATLQEMLTQALENVRALTAERDALKVIACTART